MDLTHLPLGHWQLHILGYAESRAVVVPPMGLAGLVVEMTSYLGSLLGHASNPHTVTRGDWEMSPEVMSRFFVSSGMEW